MSSRAPKPPSLALLILLISTATALAQKPSPADRLTAAAKLASLDDPTLKPWHLKLDLTVFDEYGKKPVSGVAEVWKSGSDSRTAYTLGESTYTELHHGNTTYSASTGPELPFMAVELLRKTLNPIPSVEQQNAEVPELTWQYFGKIKLDCIMLTPRSKDKKKDKPALGRAPTFCLQPDSDHILVTFDYGSESLTRRNIGIFQNHEVSLEPKIEIGVTTIATAKVTSLSTYTPQTNEFQPTSEMSPIELPVAVSPAEMWKLALNNKFPDTPAFTKLRQAEVSVVLHVIIGSEGNVRSVTPLFSNDPEFKGAVEEAVRDWTFSPYLIEGSAVPVETTIAITFGMSVSRPINTLRN